MNKKVVISPTNKKAISFIEALRNKKEELKRKMEARAFFNRDINKDKKVAG